ncbi:MAG TPA: hypothetical protein PKM63_00095 [Panacibacter sp.]|nr:hypothetical protein [Panacibacter sp.]HNP42649.1 hypothetical protein [Panacibacter sp.]
MRKPFTAAFCSLLLMAASCTKTAGDLPVATTGEHSSSNDLFTGLAVTPTTYTILKGQQYCNPNPLVFTSKSKLSFAALFDSSCIYKTVDPLNQDDINKLYGFSDCNSQHLENSARIGWRWSNDSLRIFGFVHNGGTMLFGEITTAKIGKVIKCKIVCLDTQYVFTVDGKTLSIPRHCSGNYTRYKLYPYFGGDEVAPHDITIQMADLK